MAILDFRKLLKNFVTKFNLKFILTYLKNAKNYLKNLLNFIM